jgi:transposase
LAHNELAPWGDTRSFFLFSFAQNMVLSTTEKAQIVALHKAGRSNAQLAEQFGVSVVTIKKTKRHFNERGHYERKKGSGRKKKLSAGDLRVLGRLTRKNSRATLNQLRIMSDLHVSGRTIRRRLKEMGLRARVARKKPFMSAVHRAKRLAFARKHLGWTLQQWKKVLFTDESTFEIGLNPRRVLVWRTSHERDLPANLVPTFKSGRTTQMVWGGIAHGCKTDLAIFDKCGRNERKTISDAESYVNQVYKGPLTRFLRGKRGIVLMEDGAPIHRSNAPKIWREKRRLRKLDWPPSSPDLNKSHRKSLVHHESESQLPVPRRDDT